MKKIPHVHIETKNHFINSNFSKESIVKKLSNKELQNFIDRRENYINEISEIKKPKPYLNAHDWLMMRNLSVDYHNFLKSLINEKVIIQDFTDYKQLDY